MINIKYFDPNLLSTDKISFKSMDAVIYNIKYITLKSLNHVNVYGENPPYLIFNNADGYIEESKGDKYLVFTSTDQTEEVLKKYTDLQDEITNQTETTTGGKPIEYKKDFMKIKFKPHLWINIKYSWFDSSCWICSSRR